MDKSKIIKNPQSPTEEQNSIINRFDTSQIEAAEQNNINERAMAEDTEPSAFVEKNVPDSRDESINANPNFPKFSESERFSREVNIDEKALRKQGRVEQ